MRSLFERYKGEITLIMRLNFFLIVFILVSCSGGGSQNIKNSPPEISSVSFFDPRVGEVTQFSVQASDSDGDNLTFSATGLPQWLNINAQTGLISGTPTPSNLGEISLITVSVSDGEFFSAAEPFSIEVLKPIYFVYISIDTLDQYRDMDVLISGCLKDQTTETCILEEDTLTINENGNHSFEYGIEANSDFQLDVDRDPGRQKCNLEANQFTMSFGDRFINITCDHDDSYEIFSDKLHKIRLHIDKDDWMGFALDSERASYRDVGDANGIIDEWYFRTHSEIYRKLDFEYLDENNERIEYIKDVAFKMKGSSTRQWPEVHHDEIVDSTSFKPTRFSFTIKFDEEFEDDESVYSCIDTSGNPAQISKHPCLNRISNNYNDIPENDGREFKGIDKLVFRYNVSDPSYQRELLSHTILNSFGVPASRAAHASVELKITGEGDIYGNELPITFNLGVYQMIESIDKEFLKRFFGKNGYLFKASVVDLTESSMIDPSCIPYELSNEFVNPDFCKIGVEKPDPESLQEWIGSNNYLNPAFVNSDINDGGELSQFRPYKPPLDAKTKKKSIEDGRNNLIEFINFVQTYPSSDSLNEQFDVNGFIKAQAVDIVIGAVDHYTRVGNNYYLYFNPLKEKWIYIPHDFDFAFRDSHDLTYGTPERLLSFRDIATTYALPSLNDDRVHWAGRSKGGINPILWDIIFSDPKNELILYQYIYDVINEFMDWDQLGPILEERNQRVEDIILNTQAISIDGCQYKYDPNAISAPPEYELCDSKDISIKTFIELRKETLLNELAEANIIL